MFKMLLRIAGLLIVAGAVAAAWFGYETLDEIGGLEAEIAKQESQKAFSKSKAGKEEAQEKITECEQGIEKKTTDRNVWFGAAFGALVVGLVMALLPSSRKRKARAAAPAPAQTQDAPGPEPTGGKLPG
jgi:hypothetical protein